jgi:hypothetical protein
MLQLNKIFCTQIAAWSLNAYWRSPGKLPKGDRFRNRKCGPADGDTRTTTYAICAMEKPSARRPGLGAGRAPARLFHHERPAHLDPAMAGLR